MGWARTLFLGDIGNRLDIADTEQDIQNLRRKIYEDRLVDASQDDAIAALKEENLQMALCLGALVQMMVKKEILTETERENLVRMIEG